MTDQPDEGQTLFQELLGSPGRVAIVEAFLYHPDSDLTASEVADIADVSESTFSRNIDQLLDLNLLVVSDTVGNTTFYRLDQESPLSEALARTQHALRQQSGELMNRSDTDSQSIDTSTDETLDPTDREDTVSTIVPQLFAADNATDREALADEFETAARDNPGAVIDLVPALLGLIDDENTVVAERVLATVSYAVSQHPDAVDDREVAALFGSVPAALEATDGERSERHGSP